jgi:outer membrane protein OmpA-like peptidoglycan-associated protein
MKLLVKIISGVVLTMLFSTAFCGVAQARWGFRGGWGIAPYPYPYPYYDPYYYPPDYYAPPDYGELRTEVEPNNAEVWVDGKFFGFVKNFDGPINHLKLPVGMHKVQFKAPDYKTISVNVYIAPGGLADIEYNLVPLPSGPPPPPPPPPPPEPKVEAPPPIKQEVFIPINIEFDSDKWFIKPIYHDELQRVANYLKMYPENSAAIEAYTDDRGSVAYNQRLSQKRAESVRSYLIENFGVDGSKLSAKGFGKSNPIATNKTDEGRKRNRRAELHIKPLKELQGEQPTE